MQNMSPVFCILISQFRRPLNDSWLAKPNCIFNHIPCWKWLLGI